MCFWSVGLPEQSFRFFFHFPYGRVFPRIFHIAQDVREVFLRCQCYYDVGSHDWLVYLPRKGNHLCLYRFDRFWQLECVLRYLLAGIALSAGKEKRSFRSDDYGTLRRNRFPVGYGSCFGYFYGAEWCDCCDDSRCTLLAVLYLPYQKIILYLENN